MSSLRVRQAWLARAVFWVAVGVALGVAFGDSLARAVMWLAVAVVIGLMVGNRRQIGGWLTTVRRGR